MTSSTGGQGSNQSGAYQGMFNFQQMMDDFYKYQPDEDDSEGRMMKNAMQGNFIQSGIDAQLAQQLGSFNQQLSLELSLIHI